ncbi:hypothetical protein [uncultured Chloroflexus sp.]|uniref:hypothetical protein n=1 Tax=uncultured Chloroflexus sp. TaxID=214040 RepID=UPI0026020E19|nr:hypothetical protein [uncultured Chloroflexus sp.]
MNDESNHILAAILQELKTITAELQQLRNELKATPPHQLAPTDPPTSLKQIIESANEAEEKSALAVYDWLTAKGITVRNYREQRADDAVFDQLALFLGERFATLSRIHERIRRSLSTGNGFTLNLASQSKEEIADSTQFCDMMHSYAFLSSYKYNKLTKTIYATPQRVGKVINFFTGGWFERYIYLKIRSLLSQHGLPFTCVINPKITFPNGDDFELDLFFLVENQPLWIECKTGDYQGYIAKYADMRKKLLSIPASRAILVILAIPNDLTTNLTNLYDITVANETNVFEKIATAVGIAIDPPHQQSIVPPVAVSVSSPVSALLNKAGLRPVPEHRPRVINELITIVKSLDQPTTMAHIKAVLAERVGASKSQLQDMLNAILRSGCLRDDNGQPVLSFTTPFTNLISDDPSVIERKCLESYMRAVLLANPTYFQDLNNVSEFERVVGCNISTTKRLDETFLNIDLE